ncbi:MAG: hypothetical protein VKN72_28680 [Nostocales cyanobacterium 94392]|nr:hypothetical protein [Nostocales cyanobacterium 94392]
MPNVEIKFSIPEDKHEFETYMSAHNYRSALYDIDQELRRRSKYGDKNTEFWYKMREEFWKILKDNNVSEV